MNIEAGCDAPGSVTTGGVFQSLISGIVGKLVQMDKEKYELGFG